MYISDFSDQKAFYFISLGMRFVQVYENQTSWLVVAAGYHALSTISLFLSFVRDNRWVSICRYSPPPYHAICENVIFRDSSEESKFIFRVQVFPYENCSIHPPNENRDCDRTFKEHPLPQMMQTQTRQHSTAIQMEKASEVVQPERSFDRPVCNLLLLRVNPRQD